MLRITQPIQPNTTERKSPTQGHLGGSSRRYPVTPEPLLSLAQLCAALKPILGGTVHRDRVTRRVKHGMPYHADRVTGRKLFKLSEVLDFWTVKAS